MSALALVDDNGALDHAVEIRRAVIAVQQLIDEVDVETLDEVRARAQARSLYEQQSKNRELERHFGMVRLDGLTG